jgi:hypothetical protein
MSRSIGAHLACQTIASFGSIDASGGIMTGFWLVSYIVLWLLVIVGGLIIIALAREVETLHNHVEFLLPYLSKTVSDSPVRGEQESERDDAIKTST